MYSFQNGLRNITYNTQTQKSYSLKWMNLWQSLMKTERRWNFFVLYFPCLIDVLFGLCGGYMYLQFPASEQLDSHIFLVGIMLLFNLFFIFFNLLLRPKEKRLNHVTKPMMRAGWPLGEVEGTQQHPDWMSMNYEKEKRGKRR